MKTQKLAIAGNMVTEVGCFTWVHQVAGQAAAFPCSGKLKSNGGPASRRLPRLWTRPFIKDFYLTLLATACLSGVAFCGGVVTNANEAALNAAMAGGGTVTFAINGVFTLTNTLALSNNVTLDGTGHNVTISGGGPMFSVYSNASLTLMNLTLANASNYGNWITGSVYGGYGGAICNTGMVVAVSCIFSNNAAKGFATNGLNIRSGEIVTGGLGGAIYNLGTLMVSNSVFSGNQALGIKGLQGNYGGPPTYMDIPSTPGGEGSGGAIYNGGNAFVVNCIFSNNSAIGGLGGLGADGDPYGDGNGGVGQGGGICNSGVLSVFNTTFVGNTAAGGSGGAGGYGDYGFGSPNGGWGAFGANGTGGGICAESGTNVVVNGTFSGNSASGGAGGNGGQGQNGFSAVGDGGDGGNGANGVGGGIGVLGGAAALTNLTLANNISTGGDRGFGGPAGGGSAFNGTNGVAGISQGQTLAAAGGRISLLNSILDSSAGGSNGFGSIIDAGYNLDSDSTGYLTNSTSFNNTNPDLGPLGNYGGPTPTIPLLAGSPAIDAADPNSYPPTDQRGFPRPYGPAPCIGAFEYWPPTFIPNPIITIQPQSQAVRLGSNAVLTVAVSGIGPFSYLWQFNGTNLSYPIITTVAGTGTPGYSGDGGAATNAELNGPFGLTEDGFGNLFIAGNLDNRIRKVDTNGIITTVAGSGNCGFSGDNGPATNASLENPQGVAVDASGNVFIGDYLNNRVREVGTNGIITTFAGDGASDYSGDGGPATNASLYDPEGVLLDASGNLYIADSANMRIRKVDTNGIITTMAGDGDNDYSGDGGPATNASLSYPQNLAFDRSGAMFIADYGNNAIRKVDTNGIITTVAGDGMYGYAGDGGAATNAWLANPSGVAVDSLSNLYIADLYNHRVREVGTNGIITTVAGDGTAGYSGDDGAATNAGLNKPSEVVLDGSGNLFIVDFNNNRIRKVNNTQESILALDNMTTSIAGSYDVVVTGPFGSVTSSIVTLTVELSALSASITSGNNVEFQFSGPAGSNYVLQYATRLAPPIHWQPVVTNAADTNGNWSYVDTNVSAYPARFFRLASP